MNARQHPTRLPLGEYAILQVMSDTKMLQSVLDKVTSIDKKVDDGFTKVWDEFKKVNKRLDVIGADVAQLQDDTPTIEEFDDLKKRVDKYHPETKAL